VAVRGCLSIVASTESGVDDPFGLLSCVRTRSTRGTEVPGISGFHAVQSRFGAMPDTLRLELGLLLSETVGEQPASLTEALEVRR
jgi:hypothetical protein